MSRGPPSQDAGLAGRFQPAPGGRARLPSGRAGLALTKRGGNARPSSLHSLLEVFAVQRQVLLFMRPFPINHRQTLPAPSDSSATFPSGRSLDSIQGAARWPGRSGPGQRRVREPAGCQSPGFSKPPA